MKTDIKLFVVYLIITIAILHIVTYYVTGHIPNDTVGRSGMVFATAVAIIIIFASLNLTDKKTKEEILDTILCAKDKLVDEECKKED